MTIPDEFAADVKHPFTEHLGITLEHIEDGSFGFCEKCGVDIGVERLKIRPVTTYCIACKEEQEAGESRN